MPAKNPRVTTLLSPGADFDGCAQYKRRPHLRKNAGPMSLPFPTFPYLFGNSLYSDTRAASTRIFNHLPVIGVATLAVRSRNARSQSASRTANETGVPSCLTSTLYCSTLCELYFLPEVSECLKSSHFPEPQASFSSKTEGLWTERVPENSRCLIPEDPCKGGTPKLQTNQFEHNILAAPFFPEPCKTLHGQQPRPAFFARNRGFRKQDRGSLDTWTQKMGRNKGSQPPCGILGT